MNNAPPIIPMIMAAQTSTTSAAAVIETNPASIPNETGNKDLTKAFTLHSPFSACITFQWPVIRRPRRKQDRQPPAGLNVVATATLRKLRKK